MIYELVTKDKAGRVLIGTISNDSGDGEVEVTVGRTDGTVIDGDYLAYAGLHNDLASGFMMVLISEHTLEDHGVAGVTDLSETDFIRILSDAPGAVAEVVLDFWSSQQIGGAA